MLSIQEAAKQIYSENPGKFYLFTGPEYGVKLQYLSKLKAYYNGNVLVYDSFKDILNVTKQKSLLKPNPSLSIVRYDKDILKNIVSYKNFYSDISKISGTCVGIYYEDKDEEKLDKYFSDYVVRFNKLTPEISFKHLCKEFSSLSEVHIREVIDISEDFYKATLICSSLSIIPKDIIHRMSQEDIRKLFGYNYEYDDLKFKLSIVSRNFKLAIHEIENFENDLDSLLYVILSTYVDIYKALDKPSKNSYIYSYLNLWSKESVKCMFNLTYDQIVKLRNFSSYDVYNSLIYICGLLQYKLV